MEPALQRIPNRRACTIAALLLVACAWIPAAAPVAAGTGQDPQGRRSREKLLEAARQIMEAARYCALVTTDETGQPQARTVEPFSPDERLVVWFATKPTTRKVAQIRRDPRVALYYFDLASESYVTVIGAARLVTDAAEKERRWSPRWEKFYPDRDFVLVAVTPERIEVVSNKLGIVPDPGTTAPPAVDFTRRPPAHQP
jgi:general stress protein 26